MEPAKSKVAVVTDSVAGIPKQYQQELGIHVAPNILIWSGKEYRDGIDILPEVFLPVSKPQQNFPLLPQFPLLPFRICLQNCLREALIFLVFLLAQSCQLYMQMPARPKTHFLKERLRSLIQRPLLCGWAGLLSGLPGRRLRALVFHNVS